MGRFPTVVTWDFPSFNSFLRQNEVLQCITSQGNSFSREHSIDHSFETSFPKIPTPKEKVTEYVYPVDNEVVVDLRRITRAYAKNIGGFPTILSFPRRELCKRDCPYNENLVLVEDIEELVETTL